jgi:hypothetical protein
MTTRFNSIVAFETDPKWPARRSDDVSYYDTKFDFTAKPTSATRASSQQAPTRALRASAARKPSPASAAGVPGHVAARPGPSRDWQGAPSPMIANGPASDRHLISATGGGAPTAVSRTLDEASLGVRVWRGSSSDAMRVPGHPYSERREGVLRCLPTAAVLSPTPVNKRGVSCCLAKTT